MPGVNSYSSLRLIKITHQYVLLTPLYIIFLSQIESMKKFFIIALCFCCAVKSFGNAAMPGIWSSGHGSQFYPLFEKDSVYFGKIKMQKELVQINLYPGFAAVKGEYWMYNTTDKPITITVGYPINGQYPQDIVDNVVFEDLYEIKVFVNGQMVATQKYPDTSGNIDATPASINEKIRNRGWYFWTTTFAPQTITKLTVYFLTDNSQARMRKGYNIKDGNAFAYILETGRAWGGSIDSGKVLIQLNDGLTLNNIKGILPDSTLTGDDTHIEYSFTSLEPMPENNILLWYEDEKDTSFDMNNIIQKSGDYYKSLDAFSLNAFDSRGFNLLHKNDFKIPDTASWIFGGIVIGVILFGALLIGVTIFVLYKLFWGKKNTV